MALATGRDYYEDGVGDEEKLCIMPSSSSESSFAGDNLDEVEQVAAAQLTTGGSTIVTRSMARRGGKPGTNWDTGRGVADGIHKRRRGGSLGGHLS